MPIFYDVYITSKYSFLCSFVIINVLYTCFYNFFILAWYFFPLEYIKTMILVFHVSIFKSRKILRKCPFSPNFLTETIILAKGMIWYNVQQLKQVKTLDKWMKSTLEKNSINLGCLKINTLIILNIKTWVKRPRRKVNIKCIRV